MNTGFKITLFLNSFFYLYYCIKMPITLSDDKVQKIKEAMDLLEKLEKENKELKSCISNRDRMLAEQEDVIKELKKKDDDFVEVSDEDMTSYFGSYFSK